MERYKKANGGIHAPDDLKQAVVEQGRPAPRRSYGWLAAVAAVLVLAILAGLLPGAGPAPDDPTADSVADSTGAVTNPLFPVANAATLAQAEYPDDPDYPYKDGYGGSTSDTEAWKAARDARRSAAALLAETTSLTGFYAATMRQWLRDTNGENAVYSPLNIYMALAMLCEITDGTSRQQILDLLGVEDIETLRVAVDALWTANYRDDGSTTSILGSSLWLRDSFPYHQDTLDQLAELYRASSFSGVMGDPAYDAALQQWLNEQTGGLLEEAAGSQKFDTDTILALATTIYFKASWTDEFNESANTHSVFHSATGDVTTEFMNQALETTYYEGTRFGAVRKDFSAGGAMWFFLPDEGTSVNELLTSGQVLELLEAPTAWSKQSSGIVNLSMPKFDVSGQIDLVGGLKALGVTDVMDDSRSDFSPLTDVGGIYLASADHAARVTVDEEGCIAAAFTVMKANIECAPSYVTDFTLDRPFLFAITSETGQILFLGVVNQV